MDINFNDVPFIVWFQSARFTSDSEQRERTVT